VSQPQAANRSLQFYYRPNNSLVIDHVTEVINGINRRTVQYNYSNISPGGTNYLALTGVTYYGQSQWTASYKYRAPNVAPTNGIPLLWTCDEPTYTGPMKRIAYTYQTSNNADGSSPSYGQVSLERYWDGTANHESSGVTVFTLTVGASPNNHNLRKETRGDGATRTFTYGTGSLSGYLINCTDFANHSASQAYDGKNYINSVTDRNNHTTSYSLNALTGNVTQVQYPSTPEDTMPQSNQGSTVSYTYGWNGCADTNNLDPNNPYYVCTATDQAGHVTQFTRDTNHRVTRIDYPDGGYETFTYNGFEEVLTHQRTTGGTDTYTYDTRGFKQTFKDSTNGSGNPNARYRYDVYDRVTDITDVLGGSLGDGAHTTSFGYDLRGEAQQTTLPMDPVDNARHTITNVYNADGTLQSKTDQLGHMTSYTYDDYRRVTSVISPERGDGSGTHTTSYAYYDPFAYRTNYADTNPQVSFVTLPSGKTTWIVYDDNWRTWWTTVGWNSGEDATTTYQYDNAGNVTQVTAPNQQPGQQYAGKSTQTTYDERNRPFQITDALNNTTSNFYDTVGRKKQIIRPNSQWITYDSFDNMNRVLQQTVVANWPSSMQVTKYTYWPSGLVKTMQDPHLVELNSTDNYSYTYDGMGRKTSVTYPGDPNGVHRVEHFHYSATGHLDQFTSRTNHIQTFTYDALNRMTGFSWDRPANTPSLALGYDAASRLTTINNVNANITRYYYNDNLFWGETEAITGGASKSVSYAYDGDGNRASTVYPDGTSFTYDYTGRNQLHDILSNYFTVVTYGYDLNGDMTARNFRVGGGSTYSYDALDRVTNITHSFTGDTRTFDYGYDSVGNRKWTKRDGGNGDVFNYDLAGQATGVKLNIAHPDTTPAPAATIVYDGNGNRTSFAPYGPTDSYTTNNLSQYASRNGINATYDSNGNLTVGVDGSTYTYDAQNRLISGQKASTTETFTYDGLNRQVSRSVTGQPTSYSVWDGWDLVQEYHMSGNNVIVDASYLNGPGGLVKNLTSGNCYFQDGSGSTSHLSNSVGDLKEWYRYDLQGTPTFYDSSHPNGKPATNYSVRHLFTGQQWYSEIGLYDLRNRFYSPDTGRFLQPDPIDFDGDPTNPYRYSLNNPVTFCDPLGLWTFQVGWSFNLRWGVSAWNYSTGVAIDGDWNLGTFQTLFGGLGAGGQAATGLYLAGSNAPTIFALRQSYTNINGGGGMGPNGSGQVFWGNDPTTNKFVMGGAITLGGGVGGGGSGGPSYTWIRLRWSPHSRGRGNRPRTAPRGADGRGHLGARGEGGGPFGYGGGWAPGSYSGGGFPDGGSPIGGGLPSSTEAPGGSPGGPPGGASESPATSPDISQIPWNMPDTPIDPWNFPDFTGYTGEPIGANYGSGGGIQ
jgi:RHS repeat-associated protein